MRRWLLGGLLGSGVAALAYRRRALTGDGALAAAVVGAVVFVRGGAAAAASLVTFFVSSTALSRWRERRRVDLVQAKGGRRDAWQVLANGGIATAWLVVGRERGRGGFLGGLAAAGADTWATELGMLAGRAPRLITSGRPVPPGTSGGVTPVGYAAACGGAVAVGLGWRLVSRGGGRPLSTAFVSGVVGSSVDSLIGATLQATYWCDSCGVVTEQAVHRRCGHRARLQKGAAWLDNDVVNGLATLCGSLLGAALWRERGLRWPRRA